MSVTQADRTYSAGKTCTRIRRRDEGGADRITFERKLTMRVFDDRNHAAKLALAWFQTIDFGGER